MPLTLVLGPANSAKAGEVLAAYAAAARRDALLVVPTAADAAHYDRELAAGGVALGRAVTFAGLVDEIARRAGFDAPRLTSLERERLIREVLARLPLPTLADSAAAAGFPDHAGRLVADLRRARISAPRFAAALRAWAADDSDRAAYGADVAAIVLAYASACDRVGRLDGEAFAWAAIDALRSVPRRWGATPVFVYGFDDLTGIELDVIETISRVAEAHVTVSLTYEPGRTALAARAPVVEALRGQAAAIRELGPLDEHYASGSRAALHHLERHLFEPAPPRLEPGEAVALLEAGGERAEAELVASEILAALRAGVPAGEIVVVCRSLGRSGALLERTLTRYGIRVASDRRVPLGHTALGRGLLALGRLAFAPEGPDGAGDLLLYLRTPGACASLELVDQLEAVVRRRALATMPEALAAGVVSVPEIDALRRAEDPVAELAVQTRRLLAAPHGPRAAALGPDEQVDARAAAVVLAALAELGEDGALGPVTGPELLELLGGLDVSCGARGPAGPLAPGAAVLIAEPLAIRARRFRLVVVCGLCEAEFPAPEAGEPFLGEERRHELALASGLALPAEHDPVARERYLFYACASRATERLVLSYRSSDEDGNLVLPSPFLADVAELFVPDWFDRRRRRLLADVVWSAADAPTAAERTLALADREGGAVRAAGAGAAGARAAGAEAAGAGAAGARAAGAEAAGSTRILGAHALGHARHTEVLSGGALESFAACPVRWLVERQLRPAALEPEAGPLVRGSFMHDVLERVLSGLGGPVTPASLPQAERLLQDATGSAPPALAPGSAPAVRRAILQGIEADLRRYLRHEAADGCDWAPQALELRFGMDGEDSEAELPGLELGEGDDRVLVRGVIDRVDVDPSGRHAIVRDYKSSARAERASARWLEGRQLQVAIYMLAVRRLLGLEPVAGFYQPLTGRELRARGVFLAGSEVGGHAYGTDALERGELDELLEEIERIAVEVAGALRRGELTPSPSTCSRDGCLHPGICWAVP